MSARPPAGRAAVLGVALALGGAWQAVLILVFLVAVLWTEEIAQAAAKALRTALAAVRERARQRRELDRRRLELEAALTRQARPVPCAHEHPEDVRDLAGTLVARLCPQCEAQLPPDFEVVKGTSDTGAVRLGDGHVAGLALTLAEAAVRARQTRPAGPPSSGSAP